MSTVLVIGDTILDHYIYGKVTRVNPEAPHSVVLDYEYERVFLGGACNVAANIRTISKDSDLRIHYLGATSYQVREMLSRFEIATINETHDETEILVKTRYICDNHHILRLDRNKKYDFPSIGTLIEQKYQDYDYDLIIVSDYNKGTISAEISEIILKNKAPVIFDVKVASNLPVIDGQKSKFRYDNLILKCNTPEFEKEIKRSHIKQCEAVIQTRGKEGFRIHYDGEVSVDHPGPVVSNVADVVGAGDVFLAGMAVSYLETEVFDPVVLGEFGNKCAAAKVKHFGTYTVKRREVDE